MIERLFFHIFEVIFETIIELIPPKIRKVIGIILIIIGSILTLLIAILYLVAGPASDQSGLGVVIFAMMAILSLSVGFSILPPEPDA